MRPFGKAIDTFQRKKDLPNNVLNDVYAGIIKAVIGMQAQKIR